ncbi:hypothetical protein BGZ65_005459 [Modicella reniformis]|uniref:Uncharacterized protein n=1 Tax=Modicella reniformis TaxID=1440133 RepID=A0A9P6JID0_9FUNG|nr:hypothetical protein BGZ65_005459 [Modicella reniformis]
MRPIHLHWARDKVPGVEHVTFETFVRHFKMSDRKQATDTYTALIGSDEIRSRRRKNLQDAFNEFEAHHADVFWSQRKLEISSEITSNDAAVDLQEAAVKKSSKGYSELSSRSSLDMPLDGDNLGDTEDIAALDEVSLYSPFCDLIKELYRLYGHDPSKMKLFTKPIPSPLLNELYVHAKHLLKAWREDDHIHQKQLLVALSCIINTIDEDNGTFYTKFADFKRSCIVEGFMTPTKRQVDFVDRMLHETSFLQTVDLDTLDIWSLRHACDLRVSMKQESPFYVVPGIDAMKEELTICSLVHIICNEILSSGNRACSEQEDVWLWRDVARALYHGDVVPRMGELSSIAVRTDRRRVESAISRDRTSIQARGRKIDLFFQLLSEKKPVELFCWEAKTSDAGSTQLQVQRCKNLRLNACLIGTALSMAGLDKKQSPYPLPSPLLLDIAGRTALPYRIQKIDGDVFVAGAVLEDKDLICLPRTKEEMVDFLKESGLTALLNVKALNDEYVRIIKDGMRRMGREEAKNRMLGNKPLYEARNPIINTPTKKHKVATPRTPTPKKAPKSKK